MILMNISSLIKEYWSLGTRVPACPFGLCAVGFKGAFNLLICSGVCRDTSLSVWSPDHSRNPRRPKYILWRYMYMEPVLLQLQKGFQPYIISLIRLLGFRLRAEGYRLLQWVQSFGTKSLESPRGFEARSVLQPSRVRP